MRIEMEEPHTVPDTRNALANPHWAHTMGFPVVWGGELTTCLRSAIPRQPHYEVTAVSSLPGFSGKVQQPKRQGAGKLSLKTLLRASPSA